MTDPTPSLTVRLQDWERASKRLPRPSSQFRLIVEVEPMDLLLVYGWLPAASRRTTLMPTPLWTVASCEWRRLANRQRFLFDDLVDAVDSFEVPRRFLEEAFLLAGGSHVLQEQLWAAEASERLQPVVEALEELYLQQRYSEAADHWPRLRSLERELFRAVAAANGPLGLEQ